MKLIDKRYQNAKDLNSWSWALFLMFTTYSGPISCSEHRHIKSSVPQSRNHDPDHLHLLFLPLSLWFSPFPLPSSFEREQKNATLSPGISFYQCCISCAYLPFSVFARQPHDGLVTEARPNSQHATFRVLFNLTDCVYHGRYRSSTGRHRSGTMLWC